MTNTNSHENSAQTAQDLQASLVELEALLEIERQALKARDLALLQSNTEAKEAVVNELKQLATRAAADRSTLPQGELLHKSMLDLARQVRDSNLVNGKILHRSQQSVREAINVLSGKTLDGLYGHSGQPTADVDANQEIAKA
jgi:flagellar biosynthesis/type III secretory pathway chaperone